MSYLLKWNYLFPLVLLYTNAAIAGGPLTVGGPGGHTPVTYSNPHIVFNIETGNLGSTSNKAADTLMQQAFALWNKVPTSTILLSQGADIPVDINLSNYQQYLTKPSNGLNPVVYDTDGSIINAFLGKQQSNNTVGLAVSRFTQNGHYINGYVIINGKSLPGITALDFKLIITHELGHFIGLDHTQTNITDSERATGYPAFCTTRLPDQYAVMYPFICRQTATLHADDISAVSALYPTADIKQHYGEINGFFVDPTGKAILGANIWAQNIKTGKAYSTVSDYLRNNNGFYQLFVPAGDYTLHANSINPEFTAGSGVGPYANTAFDKSFQPPFPINAVSYQTGTPSTGNVITIKNSETIHINFNSNGLTAIPKNTNRGSGNLRSPIPSVTGSPSSGGSGQVAPLSLLLITLWLSFARQKFLRR